MACPTQGKVWVMHAVHYLTISSKFYSSEIRGDDFFAFFWKKILYVCMRELKSTGALQYY